LRSGEFWNLGISMPLDPEDRLEAMADRMKERRELMLQRKSSVEHPYGTMK
jgi:hypothetical protein